MVEGAPKPKRASLPKGVKPEDATLDDGGGPAEPAAHARRASRPTATRCRRDWAASGRTSCYDKGKEGKEYRSLKGEDDVLTVQLPRALELLAQPKQGRGRRTATPIRVLGNHPDDKEPIGLYEGQYGPYVKHGDMSASLPRGSDPAAFTAPGGDRAARRQAGVLAARAPRRRPFEKEEGRSDVKQASVVGGGLAGCEAAWALAERGVRVTLHEMRPVVKTAAHQSDRLAELVCSNSFKSVELENAHGLLKSELRALGSLLLTCADEARVPGGSALAVDREVFSRAAHAKVTAHPNITVVRGEVADAPEPGRRGHRAAHVAGAGGGDRRAPWRVGARLLRCDRPDRERGIARPRRAVCPVALRKGRRRRLPERADGRCRATRRSSMR